MDLSLAQVCLWKQNAPPLSAESRIWHKPFVVLDSQTSDTEGAFIPQTGRSQCSSPALARRIAIIQSDREINSIVRLAPSARAFLARVFKVRMLTLPDSI